MNSRQITFKPKNNPRLYNGDFGLDWCDKCGGHNPAYVIISTKVDEFRLCKGCLLDGVDIINKTILDDCVTQGKHIKHGR